MSYTPSGYQLLLDGGWLGVADIERYWPGATEEVGQYDDDGKLDTSALAAILRAAAEQCFEYAPRPRSGGAIPDTWKLAHAMQARALWRSVKAGSGDGIGADGMTVTVFPMDWTVKNLLRPKGPPRIGRGRKAKP